LGLGAQLLSTMHLLSSSLFLTRGGCLLVCLSTGAAR